MPIGSEDRKEYSKEFLRDPSRYSLTRKPITNGSSDYASGIDSSCDNSHFADGSSCLASKARQVNPPKTSNFVSKLWSFGGIDILFSNRIDITLGEVRQKDPFLKRKWIPSVHDNVVLRTICFKVLRRKKDNPSLLWKYNNSKELYTDILSILKIYGFPNCSCKLLAFLGSVGFYSSIKYLISNLVIYP